MQNPFGRSDVKNPAFILSGFSIGAVAWSGHLYAILVVLLLPLVLRTANSKPQSLALIASYYAGATWTLVPGSHVFFGNSFRPLDSIVLWCVAIALLLLPWAVVFLSPPTRFAFALPFALLLAAFMPTGIVSPLTVAGLLFPHTAWLGLLLTIVGFGSLVVKPKQTLIVLACFSIVCHLLSPGQPTAPKEWIGADTRFGGSGFTTPDPFRAFHDARSIQESAIASHATVTVFPESVVKNWNEATDMLWQPTFKELAEKGHVLVLGAEQSGEMTDRYTNVLLVRGAETAVYQQRVPIPFAMWQPLSGKGVPLRLGGPATINISGTRVAPIICYEELLIEPLLVSMTEHPKLILGVANEYWAKDTFIPKLQAESLAAWSRLFWIPTVMAVNE